MIEFLLSIFDMGMISRRIATRNKHSGTYFDVRMILAQRQVSSFFDHAHQLLGRDAGNVYDQGTEVDGLPSAMPTVRGG